MGSKYDSPTMEIAGRSGINTASLDVIKTENLYTFDGAKGIWPRLLESREFANERERHSLPMTFPAVRSRFPGPPRPLRHTAGKGVRIPGRHAVLRGPGLGVSTQDCGTRLPRLF